MRKTCNALLGILTLTSVSGATLAVPAEAAEQYVSRVYKAVPDRSYPYGGSYLRRAKHSFGHP